MFHSKAGAMLAAMVMLMTTGCGDSEPAAPATAPGDLTAPAPDFKAFGTPADFAEIGYYNGQLYQFEFPSANSNNQREVLSLCFRIGPDFTGHPTSPTNKIYALFVPGASQHVCPDGGSAHDHVLSAVPGAPGYSTLWELFVVTPGPNFAQAHPPFTSEAAVLDAASNNQLLIQDAQLPLHAIVVGPARP